MEMLALLREGIAAVIQQEPDMHVVGEASNGFEAVDLFRQRQPDVTLMDLVMPGMDGSARCRRFAPNGRRRVS